MFLSQLWSLFLDFGGPVLLGGISGGIISGWVSWRMVRAETSRNLILQAYSIQSEKEAWILEGPDNINKKLSDNLNLPETPSTSSLWLRQVEVRAVLDEAKWTPMQNYNYGYINGRRVWIVRDIVQGPPAYLGALGSGWHSSLASSRALENLAGWVDQVEAAYNGRLLRKKDLLALRPLLLSLCSKDRTKSWAQESQSPPKYF